MRGGLEDAQNLQQLLTVLLKTVLSSNAEVAASHELALTDFKARTGDEVAAVMAALATVIASSTSLHGQLVSKLRPTMLSGLTSNRNYPTFERLNYLIGKTVLRRLVKNVF